VEFEHGGNLCIRVDNKMPTITNTNTTRISINPLRADMLPSNVRVCRAGQSAQRC
jgi:hypothetical protein